MWLALYLTVHIWFQMLLSPECYGTKIMYSDLQRIAKEAALVYSWILCNNSPEHTEQNQAKHHLCWSMLRPEFDAIQMY
jgi:hypothetical protein